MTAALRGRWRRSRHRNVSGAALSPAWPATVNAGDIGIIHAFYEGTTTTPDTPTGFDLLDGPRSTTTSACGCSARSPTAPKTPPPTPLAPLQSPPSELPGSTGSPAPLRWIQIRDIIGGFDFGSGTVAAVGDTAVVTPETNCLAVNLVAVEDDNPLVGVHRHVRWHLGGSVSPSTSNRPRPQTRRCRSKPRPSPQPARSTAAHKPWPLPITGVSSASGSVTPPPPRSTRRHLLHPPQPPRRR